MDIGNNEIWRAIDGYLNYEVSTHGRVRNNKTGRILKQFLAGRVDRKYYYTGLCKDGKEIKYTVHRLVCITFNENPNNYNIVDHVDRNKLNNFHTNLRWTTSENNSKNANLSKSNKSGTKGVYYDKFFNKWVSHFSINGKTKKKLFDNIDDAINYRKEMEPLSGYLSVDILSHTN